MPDTAKEELGMTNQTQLPVKMYQREGRLNVAAPMPGMEPQNISVTLSQDGRLTLSGDLRGEFKDQAGIIHDEWNPGPYLRSLDLDVGVDGTSANASYENGVLVVSLPVSDSTRPATIELTRISATEGRTAGNTGRPSQGH